MKKLFCLLLAASLILPLLEGCSADPAGKIFLYDIPYPVDNLDPQYATDSTARMIISNIFEGLLVQEPDGSLSPGAATSYSVSPDGRAYTFSLRQDTGWSLNSGKETAAVTAHDFVFAFQRMFTFSAPSPYAADFLLIDNARAVMQGLLAPSALGVRADGDFTLVITLEHMSPLFPELLATTAAMPCNRGAFQEARGRYGLERQFAGSNGPFYVSGWTDKQITLKKNEYYASQRPTLSGGATLYIGREEAVDRFADGRTDIAVIPYESIAQAENADISLRTFEKTTWCIVFNQDSGVWGNPLIRQGLAHSLEYGFFSERLEANLSPTSVIVPPATMLGGESFRAHADPSTPLAYDPDTAGRLFRMGLEALELEALPATDFYVPDTGGHALNMGLVQQGWQKNLAAYINIKPVPAGEIESRLLSGDYQILLMPFSPASPRIEALLGAFASASSQNYFGYRNPRYDQLLDEALDETSLELAVRRYAQAERLLLADAAVIPVYWEATYYAIGKNVSGIEIFPFGNKIYFKYGLKS